MSGQGLYYHRRTEFWGTEGELSSSGERSSMSTKNREQSSIAKVMKLKSRKNGERSSGEQSSGKRSSITKVLGERSSKLSRKKRGT